MLFQKYLSGIKGICVTILQICVEPHCTLRCVFVVNSPSMFRWPYHFAKILQWELFDQGIVLRKIKTLMEAKRREINFDLDHTYKIRIQNYTRFFRSIKINDYCIQE